MKIHHALILIPSCFFLLQACAVKQLAISKLGDTLAESGSVYASDNDIELIGDALPFSLKTIEGLLAEVPDHEGLLITAASGFTQYSYVYVDFEALDIEQAQPQKARELKQRAKNLYLRGRSYALRAIELKQENFYCRSATGFRYNISGVFSTGYPGTLLVFPVLGCGHGRRQVRHGYGG